MEPDPRFAALLASPVTRISRLALAHAAIWLVLFCLFAAAESWQQLTGLGIATLLAIASGGAAGFVTTNFIHEWSHFVGAVVAGGRYNIPDKVGLFVYDWDFEANSTPQFFTMSIAGSIGGILSLLLLWQALDLATAGQVAVIAGAAASFIFGAIIEWPVLWRTRRSGEPLAELSKIDPSVLLRAMLGSGASGLLAYLLLSS
jgi:hypothetical protein